MVTAKLDRGGEEARKGIVKFEMKPNWNKQRSNQIGASEGIVKRTWFLVMSSTQWALWGKSRVNNKISFLVALVGSESLFSVTNCAYLTYNICKVKGSCKVTLNEVIS